MPTEKLLIYLVAAALVLLKFIFDVLQRWRLHPTTQGPVPNAQEPRVHRRQSPRDASRDEPRRHAVSSRVVPAERVVPPQRVSAPARPPKRDASRPTHPRSAQSAARSQPSLHVERATRHRIALGSRTELRRALELMTILGPPRSRAPDDPER